MTAGAILLPAEERRAAILAQGSKVGMRAIAEARMVAIVNTTTFNLLGLPAPSIPCGITPEGLPIGLMIAGPRSGEPTLLALGAAYKKARGPLWPVQRG